MQYMACDTKMIVTFNRTIVELKPLPFLCRRIWCVAFNRTIVELKLLCPRPVIEKAVPLLIEPLWN